MKVLKFKGKIPLRKKILIAILGLIIIAIIAIIVTYFINDNLRDWIDINVLKKEVTEGDIAVIELDTDKTEYIYAFDRYIVILCNGKLELYNSYGNKEYELDISISNPLFYSSRILSYYC